MARAGAGHTTRQSESTIVAVVVLVVVIIIIIRCPALRSTPPPLRMACRYEVQYHTIFNSDVHARNICHCVRVCLCACSVFGSSLVQGLSDSGRTLVAPFFSPHSQLILLFVHFEGTANAGLGPTKQKICKRYSIHEPTQNSFTFFVHLPGWPSLSSLFPISFPIVAFANLVANGSLFFLGFCFWDW